MKQLKSFLPALFILAYLGFRLVFLVQNTESEDCWDLNTVLPTEENQLLVTSNTVGSYEDLSIATANFWLEESGEPSALVVIDDFSERFMVGDRFEYGGYEVFVKDIRYCNNTNDDELLLEFLELIDDELTPEEETVEATLEVSAEIIAHVHYVSPYKPDPASFVAEDHTQEEIMAAFEDGFADGEDPAWLAENNPLTLFEYFDGNVRMEDLEELSNWMRIGNMQEFDDQGRMILDFTVNIWADFGEYTFKVERFTYDGDETTVEFWAAIKQSDQLAYPRVAYVYYSGPLDQMNSELAF